MDNSGIKLNFKDDNLVFGNIQQSYVELKKLCIDYQAWALDPYPKKEIEILKQKISENQKLYGITTRLGQMAELELRNAEEKYKADKLLFSEGVLAKLEFYKEETIYRQKVQALENLKASLTQNQITTLDLRKLLLDLLHSQETKLQEFKNNVSLRRLDIENQISQWQASYQLKTPIIGKLSFLQPISENQ